MKKYQVLGLAVMATFAMAAAQDGTMPAVAASAEVKASTTMPRPKIMPPLRQEIKEIKNTARDAEMEKWEGKSASSTGPRRELIEDRKEMRDQNQEDRKDLRMETRTEMKSASSSDERRAIMEDARGKREDMRASNTAERKEMNERSRELAKNRVGQAVERLSMVADHFSGALDRLEKFVNEKKASTTVDMSKYEAMLTKAKSSLATVKTNLDATKSLLASTGEVTVENKTALKLSVKTTQDSVKVLQSDLKTLSNSLRDRSMWDLKSAK